MYLIIESFYVLKSFIFDNKTNKFNMTLLTYSTNETKKYHENRYLVRIFFNKHFIQMLRDCFNIKNLILMFK